jgi:hypothetical protein
LTTLPKCWPKIDCETPNLKIIPDPGAKVGY